MPRISPATHPDAKSQAMLEGIKQAMGGKVINIFATMAHSPAVLGFYLAGSGALKDAKLTPQLREQIALTSAGINHCDYCASAHTMIGKGLQLSDTDLQAALNGKAADAKAQAALTFASQMIKKHGSVTDAEVQAVRLAGYSDGEILEMVAVVAFQLFTNYFNHVAGTAVDFPLVSTQKVMV